VSYRKKKLVGNNIDSRFYSSSGHATIISGICLWIKHKKKGKLGYSMAIKYNIFTPNHYVNFHIFLGFAFKIKVMSNTYTRKVNCSRLTLARF